MKDELIKILENNISYVGQSDLDKEFTDAAEEIESHVFEFIEWLIKTDSYPLNMNTPPFYFKEFNKENTEKAYQLWIATRSKITMIPVTSSQIKSIGYDSGTLYIEFNKGTVYTYSDVPELCFKLMLKVESAGKYFSEYIKGKYDFIKTDKIVTNNEIK